MDPAKRQEHLNELLEIEGLSHIKEEVDTAYCPISLTNTPDEIKEAVAMRQRILIEKVLKPAGIKGYDPYTSPFSPDKSLQHLPNEIYLADSGRIVSARFFVGHNIMPSTGQGVEIEKAKTFNRISVILMDKKIRISRMLPHRSIYLKYEDFEKEYDKFIPVFELLKKYDPGVGFKIVSEADEPILLGFHKESGEVVDLEDLVYKNFSDLKYKYDENVDALKLRVLNKEVFR